MTEKQEKYRKSMISRIHMYKFVQQAKAAEGWDEWLSARYGVASTTRLSLEELINLDNILSGIEKEVRVGGTRPNKDDNRATDKQVHTIETDWKSHAKKPDGMALREFIGNIIKRKPLHLTSLTKQEATKIITAIKKL